MCFSEKTNIHPDYNHGQLYDNIAILRLRKVVPLQEHNNLYPAAVCLPGKHSNLQGHGNFTITTWAASQQSKREHFIYNF